MFFFPVVVSEGFSLLGLVEAKQFIELQPGDRYFHEPEQYYRVCAALCFPVH